ncbi:hypothetical protein PPBDW_I10166 [Photobacterium kishitanii]|nr:hypothetical protein PPBDW_I10166 [Photobacterium kishitanii]
MPWVIFIDSPLDINDLETDLSVGFFMVADQLNQQWITINVG